MMLTIEIAVPTAVGYWGDVTDEQARMCARTHLATLVQWAREQWPDAVVGAAEQSQTDSITHGVAAYDDEHDHDDIAQVILGRAQDTWSYDADRALAGETRTAPTLSGQTPAGVTAPTTRASALG